MGFHARLPNAAVLLQWDTAAVGDTLPRAWLVEPSLDDVLGGVDRHWACARDLLCERACCRDAVFRCRDLTHESELPTFGGRHTASGQYHAHRAFEADLSQQTMPSYRQARKCLPSGSEKIAVCEAMIKSPDRAISKPPIATPFTAAITGLIQIARGEIQVIALQNG
jgi:hypothetical protein